VIIVDLTALGRVKHNGNWYEPGDDIKKVKKEDGERLIQLGVAEESVNEQKKKDEEAARLKAEAEAKVKAEAEAKAKAEAEEAARKQAEEEARLAEEKKKKEAEEKTKDDKDKK
jgi:NADH dehydrogenase [ubiquinone] 1 alpha subcomplex assembly factor 7